MLSSNILIIISFSLGLFLSLWFIPIVRRILIANKLVVTDMNKINYPKTPSMGGIGIVFAFIISINLITLSELILQINYMELKILLPALLSILMMSFVGFIDDILMFPFRPLKPILALFASIPMITISYNNISVIEFPFSNIEIHMGIFYSLLIVPLIIVFCSNVFNVMADFDGLSSGNGIIISTTLLICSIMSHKTTSALIFSTLLGTLIILYFYNKFPAKIFAGNIGTLFIGSIFAVGCLIGNLKYALFITMIPYITHFMLQEIIIFKNKNILARPRERGIPQKDGSLQSQYKKSYGLTHFFMLHINKITEKKLVFYLIGLESIFCILAILFHFQHLYLAN